MTKVLCSKSNRKIGFRGSLPSSWAYCSLGGKVTLLQCLGKAGYEKYFGKVEFGKLEEHEPCNFCLGVSDTMGIRELKPPKDERWTKRKTMKIEREDMEKVDKKDVEWLREEIERLKEELGNRKVEREENEQRA